MMDLVICCLIEVISGCFNNIEFFWYLDGKFLIFILDWGGKL